MSILPPPHPLLHPWESYFKTHESQYSAHSTSTQANLCEFLSTLVHKVHFDSQSYIVELGLKKRGGGVFMIYKTVILNVKPTEVEGGFQLNGCYSISNWTVVSIHTRVQMHMHECMYVYRDQRSSALGIFLHLSLPFCFVLFWFWFGVR